MGFISNPSNTYSTANKCLAAIIDDNVEYSKCLGFTLTEKEKALFIMYWIPKIRFIIASKICSTKKISKLVSHNFKLIYSQTKNFHKITKFFSNCDKFWALLNSDPITDSLNKINKKKCEKSIATYDFSTLYTELSHTKLVDKLSSVTDFALKEGNKSYIRISTNGKAYSARNREES